MVTYITAGSKASEKLEMLQYQTLELHMPWRVESKCGGVGFVSTSASG